MSDQGPATTAGGDGIGEAGRPDTGREPIGDEARDARFRALMEQAPFSVQVLSPDGRTLRVNAAWEKLWGLRLDQLSDYNLLQDPQLEAKGVLPLLRRAFAGEAVEIPAIQYDPNETIPARTRHEDARRWVSAVAYPLKDAHGRIAEVVLMHQDITDRKRTEDALSESEERYRGIVSQSIAGVAEVDLTGRFLFANDRYCAIVGRSIEELRGLRMQDISHPDDLRRNQPLFEHAGQAGTPFVIEKRYVRPDGSVVWVNNSVSALRRSDGEIRSVVAVCVDVTDRRRAEEAQREEEERLRTVTDNLPQGAVYRVVHDPADGTNRFTFLSAGVEEIFGVTAAEGVADSATVYGLIHEEDINRVLEREVVSLREMIPFDVEFRIRHRAGGVKWIHCRSAPHRLPSGGIVWEGVILDVTARKEAEEALREADRRKDEFLAMLGHELRNPLAPIRTGLDLLGLERPGNSIIELMKGQVDHLVRLVDDLLDVSRIMRGKIELRKEPIELAKVISQAIETARPVIDGQHHELTRSLPAEPVWLDADPVRLTQVFANLLNNAAKYTSPHGHLWIHADAADESVTVRVRDDGIGIDPQLLPAVFDLFTQGDRAIDRSQGGLGIGLTVVKSLVEMHGGRVTAHSEGEGRGSEFVVELPVQAAGRTSRRDREPSAVKQSLRILVVDDNRAAADMLKLLLLELGPHHVGVAHDGPAALAAIEKEPPQLVLLDLGLPGMSGYEVARQIRLKPANSNIVIAAITGYGTSADRRETEAAGFDDHLVKPAEIDALRRLFRHQKLTVPNEAPGRP